MKQGSLRSSAYAVLTAFIWGTAFVAQSVGAEHVPPLAFMPPVGDRLCVLLVLMRRHAIRPPPEGAGCFRHPLPEGSAAGRLLVRPDAGTGLLPSAKGSGYHLPWQGGLHHRPLHRAGAHFRHFPEEASTQGGVGQCAAGGDGTVLPVHHGELYHRPRRPLRDACAPLCLQHRSFWWITLSPWWTAWSCPAVSSSLSRRFP